MVTAASRWQRDIRWQPHHRMLWNMVSPPLALAEPAAEELAPDGLLKKAERLMESLQPTSGSFQGSLCRYAQ